MFKIKKEKKKTIKCTAIILAAGRSERMKEYENKQFIIIGGRPILSYSIEAFEESIFVGDIIIVTREEDIIYCKKNVIEPFGFRKVSKIVSGGETRTESSYLGLIEADEGTDIIIIHDGARPNITSHMIDEVIEECIDHHAVCMGVKAKDTIKVVDQSGFVDYTPDREQLWHTQTPQAFEYNIIIDSYKNALDNNIESTDDSAMVGLLGHKVKMVEGSYENIKITTASDINIIKSYLERF